MKKIIQLFCFSALPFVSQAQVHSAKAEYMGLVSELVYIKQSSENLAQNILNDPNSSPMLKSEVTEQYNNVKTVSDQFILQLIADSKRKNSLCYFHTLDKKLVCQNMRQLKKEYYDERTYYCSAKIEAYVYNLIKLNKLHHKLLNHEGDMSYYSGETKGMPALDNVMNLFSTTIKDVRESRAEKVEKLSVMLDGLRLCPVQNLIKPAEKKTEEAKTVVLIPEKKYRATKKKCKCR